MLQLLFLSFRFFILFRFLFGVRLFRFFDFLLQQVNLFLLQSNHLLLCGFLFRRRRRRRRRRLFRYFVFFDVVRLLRMFRGRTLRRRGLGFLGGQRRLLLEELFLRRRHLRPVFKLSFFRLHLLFFLSLLRFLLGDWSCQSRYRRTFFFDDFDVGVPALWLHANIGHEVLRIRFFVQEEPVSRVVR